MKQCILSLCIITLASLACGGESPTPPPPPETSIFDSGRTAYGFFPVPPEPKVESAIQLFEDMGEHGDFVLIQQNTAWEEFVDRAEGESQTRADLINQTKLAHQNGLEYIFVLDPLNGLNRREFIGLPVGWEASFANPDVRTAHKNYALWVVRAFHPRYLGLASEINTYMDAHPDDAPNFISLYNEIYALVKAEAPETQIFVTFQWDDLNNMFHQPEEGNRQKFDTNWEQVEAFEPNLDVWAISTYPYFVFSSASDIPADYYSPLLTRTDKPVAVAEGGFSSQVAGPIQGSPEDQVAYLNAIHDQLGGSRFVFWVNLLLTDFNIEAMTEYMLANGQNAEEAGFLGYFGHTGFQNFDRSPKPALEVWEAFRSGK
ncbi:MAG: hypothetical protein HXY42_11530 [Chloroflexi bacterium]|nr:hypothetical protein [Chloroflexota bacterium]